MNTVRIIHCADLHFDTPFSGLSRDKAEIRKEDLRETFSKIIKMAGDERVQLLLIAGDVFDNNCVMTTTIDHIIKKFEEIPDTKVFISPGNHDPYHLKSFYSMVEWPENVHIFSNRLEKVRIEDLDVCVYGCGFSASHEKEPLVDNFFVEEDNCINIMVLHGEVVDRMQACDYNPVLMETIENSGLDYIALGHRHGFSEIKKAGNTYWAYCGSPEGRGFDELGSKGIIFGEIGKNFVDLKFKEICKRKYFELEVDISGCFTYEDIAERIKKSLGGQYDFSKNLLNYFSKDLYKIILIGEIHGEFNLRIPVIREKLMDYVYYIRIIDDTKAQIDYEELGKEISLKGIFVKRMLDKIESAQEQSEIHKYKKALKLGLKALNGEEGIIG